MTQKHDLTLHFPECSHSECVAEDVMADLYPAFVFLLLPLCHLLRYLRLGSLGAVCSLPVCGAHGGAGQFTSPRGRTTDDSSPLNAHRQVYGENCRWKNVITRTGDQMTSVVKHSLGGKTKSRRPLAYI